MDGSYRKPWDEPQGEASQVGDELETEKTGASRQKRSKSSFPTRDEGRDGDEVVVAKSSGVYNCMKVRGRWYKVKLEEV